MALLGDLFRHSPWVVHAVIAHRPCIVALVRHATRDSVIATMLAARLGGHA